MEISKIRVSGVDYDIKDLHPVTFNILEKTPNKHILQMLMSNGEKIEADFPNPLKGKKISILGDSISTFNGYMPNGYVTYYPNGDITSVEKTWWYQLVNENEMELVSNASWSGSCVTGDSTSDTNASAGCSNARISHLSNNGVTPDIIIIYIGINDFANKPLGDYTGNTAIPSEGNIETFSEAYGVMVKKILTAYPNAKVFCCTLLETANTYYDIGENATYPTVNKNNIPLGDYNDKIKIIASRLGANMIDLHSCGINFWNLSNNTMDLLHPNATGACLIKEYIENALKKEL